MIGNPNVGKSTVFNALTGMHQHTGNWCGKTVECAAGNRIYRGREYRFVDLPGCYSLSCRSSEEEISRDYILQSHPDVVVAVCDATCLERNLNLVLQICAVTPHVLLCVNLMDEARKKHIRIDFLRLQKELRVPVIGITARSRKGLEHIFGGIEDALSNTEAVSPVPDIYCKNAEMCCASAEYCGTYVQQAAAICRACVTLENPDYARRDRKLDRIFTSKCTGFPIMLLFLLCIFWITIVGANVPSDLLNKGLFWLEPRFYHGLLVLGIPEILCQVLIYGVYRVAAWVVSVMLPPMAIFFPLFTLLEDYGYLPRVAFNLDHCFQKCCACGKQALTMWSVDMRIPFSLCIRLSHRISSKSETDPDRLFLSLPMLLFSETPLTDFNVIHQAVQQFLRQCFRFCKTVQKLLQFLCCILPAIRFFFCSQTLQSGRYLLIFRFILPEHFFQPFRTDDAPNVVFI